MGTFASAAMYGLDAGRQQRQHLTDEEHEINLNEASSHISALEAQQAQIPQGTQAYNDVNQKLTQARAARIALFHPAVNQNAAQKLAHSLGQHFGLIHPDAPPPVTPGQANTMALPAGEAQLAPSVGDAATPAVYAKSGPLPLLVAAQPGMEAGNVAFPASAPPAIQTTGASVGYSAPTPGYLKGLAQQNAFSSSLAPVDPPPPPPPPPAAPAPPPTTWRNTGKVVPDGKGGYQQQQQGSNGTYRQVPAVGYVPPPEKPARQMKGRPGFILKGGKTVGVLFDPITNAVIPGSEHEDALPPRSAVGTIRSGTSVDAAGVATHTSSSTRPNFGGNGGSGSIVASGGSVSSPRPATPASLKAAAKASTPAQLDDSGNVPESSDRRPVIRGIANDLLAGVDPKQVRSQSGKDFEIGKALAEKFGYHQEAFSPREQSQIFIGQTYLNAFKQSSSLNVLQSPISRAKLADLFSKHTSNTGIVSASAVSLTPDEQEYVRLYNQAVGTVGSLRQLTGNRITESGVQRLLKELPNPTTTRDAAGARRQLDFLLNEVDLVKKNVRQGKGDKMTPGTVPPQAGSSEDDLIMHLAGGK